MNDKRKSFTFVWKIKNFSYSFRSSYYFISPIFFVREMCRTNWSLVLYTQSRFIEDGIACKLHREIDDFHSDVLELDYELSFIAGDGSVLYTQLFLKKLYTIGYIDHNSSLSVKNEVFVPEKHLLIPNDTLIIRCKMWKSQGSIKYSARCSVETRINTQCITLIGEIEKFSKLKASSKNMACIKSSSKHIFFSMNLCVGDDNKLDIEMKLLNHLSKYKHRFQVFIMDAHKNKVKICERDIYDTQLFRIPLSYSKDYLLANKEIFLLNNVLTLKCEIIHIGSNKLKIIDMFYEYDYQNFQALSTDLTTSSPSSEEQHYTENITTLKDGLISLFNEGELCDIKLRTATETFPVHKVVLSARSPVFKSIFDSDMREKTNNCVDIEDLNTDTVRQMLLFMYSDNLDNLEYESAKSLYFAADKYDIVTLRQKCSNFLRKSLLPSNCCDVLLLADRHQDTVLKRYAQDCIAENDEVFSFDEWKYLEENYPRLTTETLRIVCSYMKKGDS